MGAMLSSAVQQPLRRYVVAAPALNYAPLPDNIKGWLSFMMLLGRLEIYTVLIIFTRSFWRA